MSVIEREVIADDTENLAELRRVFSLQKAAFLKDPHPDFDTRVARINSLVAVVLKYRDEMKAALCADFGWHPHAIADLIEILGIAGRAAYTISQLQQWMAVDPRPIDPGLWGSAQASVRQEPKGVIGNMVPWNFPFDIAFGPAIDMLAAGNRVILKPSDLSPACGALMARMIEEAFEPDLVWVSNGGVDLAKAFPTLGWDHLMYTGSSAIGKSVMRAAAENLVPVTLELGGKSPAILAPDAVTPRSVANVLGMKMLKSGQVCVAPDHVFVPCNLMDKFLDLAAQHLREVTPDHVGGVDCTAIIAQRHFARLERMLEQARQAGCRVIQPEAGAAPYMGTRQMPLTLVVEPADNLALMQEEIFGPILPVIPYDNLENLLGRINGGERPLALYIYTEQDSVAEYVIHNTHSGGVGVNVAVLHGALAPLPFGGVGNSGMGRHHGIEGSREFSNPRGVFKRGTDADMIDAFNPPYRTLEMIVSGAYAQADGAAPAGEP